MRVQELIEELQKMPNDKLVIIFSTDSVPFEIAEVKHDTVNDGLFSHIVIKQIEL